MQTAGWVHNAKSVVLLRLKFKMNTFLLKASLKEFWNVNFVPHLCFLFTRQYSFHLTLLLVLAWKFLYLKVLFVVN